MCGEQYPAREYKLGPPGSPPRVRGTAGYFLPAWQHPGITPACAGNSVSFAIFYIQRGDHPRVCGEQPPTPPSMGQTRGSPPRVRGTEKYPRGQPNAMRITPACAGNRICKLYHQCNRKDHPRVCGEQHLLPCREELPPGSPPRVRGTAGHSLGGNNRIGITPACAGNRYIDVVQGLLQEDHPRVCGEQIVSSSVIRCLLGSPPRVRGTEIQAGKGLGRDRITPACAGNRPTLAGRIVMCADHPRVCGEQLLVFTHSPLHTGSPPRVRGTAPL